MTREELIRMPEYHTAQASDAYLKECSFELPPELVHYDVYWASNTVLTRKKGKTRDGLEKYEYHVCVYLFDEQRWMILDNQMQFYEPDEWIELDLYP